MRVAITIAMRELGSYVRQPAGWIIVALYLLLSGLVFCSSTLVPGRPATLRDFFALSGWLLLPVVPAVSMRLMAEELRSGTIENLLTAPVSSWSLVLGKYLGAMLFLLAMLLPTLIYPILLFAWSAPTPVLGPVISGYVCLVLLGGIYLGIGLLASCLTANATLAFMMTLFAILGVLFAPSAADIAPAPLKPLLASLSLSTRIADFSRGVLDTAHISVFAIASVVLVVASVAVMEVRRWR
ncbi:MAG: ABC transporter permease [Planctomycetota bacterium]|nr:ABC transporter permease [Planctomycetota bacterium]